MYIFHFVGKTEKEQVLNSGGNKMSDKTLVCRDCGQEFVFTTGEQEFYKEKGFTNEPTRCAA